jgi:hypothetical protein
MKIWQKKRKWKNKEKRDAKDFCGTRTPRSGGFWNKPGDVSQEDFLFDCKETDKKSYSVTIDTLKKIQHESLKNNKMPALSIELGDKTEFVVLLRSDFLLLLKQS